MVDPHSVRQRTMKLKYKFYENGTTIIDDGQTIDVKQVPPRHHQTFKQWFAISGCILCGMQSEFEAE